MDLGKTNPSTHTSKVIFNGCIISPTQRLLIHFFYIHDHKMSLPVADGTVSLVAVPHLIIYQLT